MKYECIFCGKINAPKRRTRALTGELEHICIRCRNPKNHECLVCHDTDPACSGGWNGCLNFYGIDDCPGYRD